MMDLGKRLKALRISEILNQVNVANVSGVERSTYGKYETGDSFPNYAKLIRLLIFFISVFVTY